MPRPSRMLVNYVVAALDSEPNEWTFDHYWAKHKSRGIGIWIANRAYGMDVTVGEVEFRGGVIPFVAWLTWRGRIYRAVVAAMNAKAERALAVPVQPVTEG